VIWLPVTVPPEVPVRLLPHWQLPLLWMGMM
jgi:hypothetical protein